MTKNLVPIAIVIAGLAIAGAFLYVNKEKVKTPATEFLSAQQAAEKAIDYINKNMLQGGASASLVSVVEESGIYKFRLKIEEQEFNSYVTKDGKILFPEEGISLESAPTSVQEEEKTSTIGNFSVSADEICKENEKPIFYFFGSKGCPHCTWEHPLVEKVAKDFEEYISFHNNMDSNADMNIFSKYSEGGIPTLVFGCKYYRVGSGERAGEESETKTLTALICKLTENQPSNICNSVQDLINQIKN